MSRKPEVDVVNVSINNDDGAVRQSDVSTAINMEQTTANINQAVIEDSKIIALHKLARQLQERLNILVAPILYDGKRSLASAQLSTKATKSFIHSVMPVVSVLQKNLNDINAVIVNYKNEKKISKEAESLYEKLIIEQSEYSHLQADNGYSSIKDNQPYQGFADAPHINKFPLDEFAHLPRQQYKDSHQNILKYGKANLSKDAKKYKNYYQKRAQQVGQVEDINRLSKSFKPSLEENALETDITNITAKANFQVYQLPGAQRQNFTNYLEQKLQHFDSERSKLKGFTGLLRRAWRGMFGGDGKATVTRQGEAVRALLFDIRLQSGKNTSLLGKLFSDKNNTQYINDLIKDLQGVLQNDSIANKFEVGFLGQIRNVNDKDSLESMLKKILAQHMPDFNGLMQAIISNRNNKNAAYNKNKSFFQRAKKIDPAYISFAERLTQAVLAYDDSDDDIGLVIDNATLDKVKKDKKSPNIIKEAKQSLINKFNKQQIKNNPNAPQITSQSYATTHYWSEKIAKDINNSQFNEFIFYCFQYYKEHGFDLNQQPAAVQQPLVTSDNFNDFVGNRIDSTNDIENFYKNMSQQQNSKIFNEFYQFCQKQLVKLDSQQLLENYKQYKIGKNSNSGQQSSTDAIDNQIKQLFGEGKNAAASCVQGYRSLLSHVVQYHDDQKQDLNVKFDNYLNRIYSLNDDFCSLFDVLTKKPSTDQYHLGNSKGGVSATDKVLYCLDVAELHLNKVVKKYEKARKPILEKIQQKLLAIQAIKKLVDGSIFSQQQGKYGFTENELNAIDNLIPKHRGINLRQSLADNFLDGQYTIMDSVENKCHQPLAHILQDKLAAVRNIKAQLQRDNNAENHAERQAELKIKHATDLNIAVLFGDDKKDIQSDLTATTGSDFHLSTHPAMIANQIKKVDIKDVMHYTAYACTDDVGSRNWLFAIDCYLYGFKQAFTNNLKRILKTTELKPDVKKLIDENEFTQALDSSGISNIQKTRTSLLIENICATKKIAKENFYDLTGYAGKEQFFSHYLYIAATKQQFSDYVNKRLTYLFETRFSEVNETEVTNAPYPSKILHKLEDKSVVQISLADDNWLFSEFFNQQHDYSSEYRALVQQAINDKAKQFVERVTIQANSKSCYRYNFQTLKFFLHRVTDKATQLAYVKDVLLQLCQLSDHSANISNSSNKSSYLSEYQLWVSELLAKANAENPNNSDNPVAALKQLYGDGVVEEIENILTNNSLIESKSLSYNTVLDKALTDFEHSDKLTQYRLHFLLNYVNRDIKQQVMDCNKNKIYFPVVSKLLGEKTAFVYNSNSEQVQLYEKQISDAIDSQLFEIQGLKLSDDWSSFVDKVESGDFLAISTHLEHLQDVTDKFANSQTKNNLACYRLLNYIASNEKRTDIELTQEVTKIAGRFPKLSSNQEHVRINVILQRYASNAKTWRPHVQILFDELSSEGKLDANIVARYRLLRLENILDKLIAANSLSEQKDIDAIANDIAEFEKYFQGKAITYLTSDKADYKEILTNKIAEYQQSLQQSKPYSTTDNQSSLKKWRESADRLLTLLSDNVISKQTRHTLHIIKLLNSKPLATHSNEPFSSGLDGYINNNRYIYADVQNDNNHRLNSYCQQALQQNFHVEITGDLTISDTENACNWNELLRKTLKQKDNKYETFYCTKHQSFIDTFASPAIRASYTKLKLISLLSSIQRYNSVEKATEFRAICEQLSVEINSLSQQNKTDITNVLQDYFDDKCSQSVTVNANLTHLYNTCCPSDELLAEYLFKCIETHVTKCHEKEENLADFNDFLIQNFNKNAKQGTAALVGDLRSKSVLELLRTRVKQTYRNNLTQDVWRPELEMLLKGIGGLNGFLYAYRGQWLKEVITETRQHLPIELKSTVEQTSDVKTLSLLDLSDDTANLTKWTDAQQEEAVTYYRGCFGDSQEQALFDAIWTSIQNSLKKHQLQSIEQLQVNQLSQVTRDILSNNGLFKILKNYSEQNSENKNLLALITWRSDAYQSYQESENLRQQSRSNLVLSNLTTYCQSLKSQISDIETGISLENDKKITAFVNTLDGFIQLVNGLNVATLMKESQNASLLNDLDFCKAVDQLARLVNNNLALGFISQEQFASDKHKLFTIENQKRNTSDGYKAHLKHYLTFILNTFMVAHPNEIINSEFLSGYLCSLNIHRFPHGDNIITKILQQFIGITGVSGIYDICSEIANEIVEETKSYTDGAMEYANSIFDGLVDNSGTWAEKHNQLEGCIIDSKRQLVTRYHSTFELIISSKHVADLMTLINAYIKQISDYMNKNDSVVAELFSTHDVPDKIKNLKIAVEDKLQGFKDNQRIEKQYSVPLVNTLSALRSDGVVPSIDFQYHQLQQAMQNNFSTGAINSIKDQLAMLDKFIAAHPDENDYGQQLGNFAKAIRKMLDASENGVSEHDVVDKELSLDDILTLADELSNENSADEIFEQAKAKIPLYSLINNKIDLICRHSKKHYELRHNLSNINQNIAPIMVPKLWDGFNQAVNSWASEAVKVVTDLGQTHYQQLIFQLIEPSKDGANEAASSEDLENTIKLVNQLLKHLPANHGLKEVLDNCINAEKLQRLSGEQLNQLYQFVKRHVYGIKVAHIRKELVELGLSMSHSVHVSLMSACKTHSDAADITSLDKAYQKNCSVLSCIKFEKLIKQELLSLNNPSDFIAHVNESIEKINKADSPEARQKLLDDLLRVIQLAKFIENLVATNHPKKSLDENAIKLVQDKFSQNMLAEFKATATPLLKASYQTYSNGNGHDINNYQALLGIIDKNNASQQNLFDELKKVVGAIPKYFNALSIGEADSTRAKQLYAQAADVLAYLSIVEEQGGANTNNHIEYMMGSLKKTLSDSTLDIPNQPSSDYLNVFALFANDYTLKQFLTKNRSFELFLGLPTIRALIKAQSVLEAVGVRVQYDQFGHLSRVDFDANKVITTYSKLSIGQKKLVQQYAGYLVGKTINVDSELTLSEDITTKQCPVLRQSMNALSYYFNSADNRQVNDGAIENRQESLDDELVLNDIQQMTGITRLFDRISLLSSELKSKQGPSSGTLALIDNYLRSKEYKQDFLKLEKLLEHSDGNEIRDKFLLVAKGLLYNVIEHAHSGSDAMDQVRAFRDDIKELLQSRAESTNAMADDFTLCDTVTSGLRYSVKYCGAKLKDTVKDNKYEETSELIEICGKGLVTLHSELHDLIDAHGCQYIAQLKEFDEILNQLKALQSFCYREQTYKDFTTGQPVKVLNVDYQPSTDQAKALFAIILIAEHEKSPNDQNIKEKLAEVVNSITKDNLKVLYTNLAAYACDANEKINGNNLAATPMREVVGGNNNGASNSMAANLAKSSPIMTSTADNNKTLRLSGGFDLQEVSEQQDDDVDTNAHQATV